MTTANFPTLAAALNRQSWDYLQDNYPDIADALAVEVKQGGKPGDIRRFVQRYTLRDEIARRCEQAAGWLVSQKGE